MIEGRDSANLAVEALAETRGADLDGDWAIQARIDGTEHVSHAARAEQCLHAIDAELPARLQHRRPRCDGCVVGVHVADIPIWRDYRRGSGPAVSGFTLNRIGARGVRFKRAEAGLPPRLSYV
jgi:hypothetical protein